MDQSSDKSLWLGRILVAAAALLLGVLFLENRIEKQFLPLRAQTSVLDGIEESASNHPTRAYTSVKHSINPPTNALKTVTPHAVRLSPTQKLVCALKAQHAPLTWEGSVRFHSHSYFDPILKKMGISILILSSACPQGTYSYARMTSTFRLEKVMDCQSQSLSQDEIASRFQGAITAHPPSVNLPSGDEPLQLALLGPARFLMRCSHLGFVATRAGNFHWTAEGFLKSQEDCEVWSRPTSTEPQGSAIHTLQKSDLDSSGCFAHGQCLNLIDVNDSGEENFSIFDRTNLLVNVAPARLVNSDQTKVISHHLEVPDTAKSPRIDFAQSWPVLDMNFSCP